MSVCEPLLLRSDHTDDYDFPSLAGHSAIGPCPLLGSHSLWIPSTAPSLSFSLPSPWPAPSSSSFLSYHPLSSFSFLSIPCTFPFQQHLLVGLELVEMLSSIAQSSLSQNGSWEVRTGHHSGSLEELQCHRSQFLISFLYTFTAIEMKSHRRSGLLLATSARPQALCEQEPSQSHPLRECQCACPCGIP